MGTAGTSPSIPGGQAEACPVCGPGAGSESPAASAASAPCQRCGYLVWFTAEKVGGVQVIRPTVRILDPGALDKLIEAMRVANPTQLVLDFSEVELFPSACLGKFCRMNKNFEAAGGQLVMRGLSRNLLDVFEITGLNRVFRIES